MQRPNWSWPPSRGWCDSQVTGDVSMEIDNASVKFCSRTRAAVEWHVSAQKKASFGREPRPYLWQPPMPHPAPLDVFLETTNNCIYLDYDLRILLKCNNTFDKKALQTVFQQKRIRMKGQKEKSVSDGEASRYCPLDVSPWSWRWCLRQEPRCVMSWLHTKSIVLIIVYISFSFYIC